MVQPNDPVSTPPQRPVARYSWNDVWTMVIMRPSVETFQMILDDPAASPMRGLRWVYLTLIVTTFVTLNALFNNATLLEQMSEMMGADPELLRSSFFLSLLCSAPIASILGTGVFAVFAWAVSYLAGRLANSVSPEQQRATVYALAAGAAPMNLIGALFAIIPVLGILGLAASLYQVFLGVQGVRAIYKLELQQAAVAVIAPAGALFLLQLLLLGGLG